MHFFPDKKKLLIPLAIGTMLSALTLFMAFRNVPFPQLISYLGVVNYWWLAPTVALGMTTFILRAVRWRLILGHIVPLRFGQAFHPLMIGFMMNCILPGRIGELARPLILKQRNGVPVTTGLATVAAERIFDFIILLVLFIIFFSNFSDRTATDGDYFGFQLNSQILKSVAWAMVRLSLVLLLGIGLLAVGASRRLIKAVIHRTGRWLVKRIPHAQKRIDAMIGFFLGIIDNFSIGLVLMRNPMRLTGCAFLTILIWALTALSYLVFANGCPGINLSFIELTTVMVVICFAIALPSVPGFWGLWEAGGLFALSFFGVSGNAALGFILLNHAAQIFPVVVAGLISAIMISVNILNITGKDANLKGKKMPTVEGV